MKVLSICPYTLTQVESNSKFNREHVIPDALGGPNGFSLIADAKTNSVLGETVDADLINNDLVRMIAVKYNIITRTGTAELRLKGVAEFKGEKIQQFVTFKHDDLLIKTATPIIKDYETNHVKGIVGWGEEASTNAEIVKRNFLRKGIQSKLGEIESHSDQAIKTGLVHNQYFVTRGLSKIAYLALAYTFGEEFIKSDAGKMFRLAFLSKSSKDFQASGIVGKNHETLFPFPIDIKPGEHLLVASRSSTGYACDVKLFNEELLTATFIAKCNLKVKNFEGFIYNSNLNDCVMKEENITDFIIRYSGEMGKF